jgi:hypothetical protein
MIIGRQPSPGRVLWSTAGVRADERHAETNQAGQVVHRAYGLIRRDTDDEGNLDGVQISEARNVALIEERTSKWDTWALAQTVNNVLHAGRIRSA